MRTIIHAFALAFACCVLPILPTWADDSIELIVQDGTRKRIDGVTLSTMPRQQVSAGIHDGPLSSWSGVALGDLLAGANTPHGDALRGAALTWVVRITAEDGYQVVFTLSELDANFSNLRVLIADTKDGNPLGSDGPYRLIVPGDKRTARSVRSLRRIEILDCAQLVPKMHTPDASTR